MCVSSSPAAPLQSRAFHGVKQDIVALTEIQHIGASSARRLFNEGLRTAQVIAKASVDVIFNALSKGKLTMYWHLYEDYPEQIVTGGYNFLV